MKQLWFLAALGMVACGAYRWVFGIPDALGNLPPGPPPPTPGVPFYQDFRFWAWATGAGVTAAHSLIKEGIPKIPTIPFTPAHRRRLTRKAAERRPSSSGTGLGSS